MLNFLERMEKTGAVGQSLKLVSENHPLYGVVLRYVQVNVNELYDLKGKENTEKLPKILSISVLIYVM